MNFIKILCDDAVADFCESKSILSEHILSTRVTIRASKARIHPSGILTNTSNDVIAAPAARERRFPSRPREWYAA